MIAALNKKGSEIIHLRTLFMQLQGVLFLDFKIITKAFSNNRRWPDNSLQDRSGLHS